MTELQKGNIFIIAEVILWSFFPIVSLLGLEGMPSIVSLFWVNLFSTSLFLLIMLYRNKWYELKNIQLWYYTIGIVVFIGMLFYPLFFYALTKTVPANAAIVALFEIVPSYILFQILKKEHFNPKHIWGIMLAVTGALIVLLPDAEGAHIGDLIIILAVCFAPFGNWCQQQARKIGSVEAILFLRHLLMIPALLIIIYFMNFSLQIAEMKNVLPWLLINGIFIFGISKILWIEAIHRMSVTKALAINSLGPILTVFFSWLLLSHKPTIFQFFAIPFFIAAIFILTDYKFNKIQPTLVN